MLRMVRVKSNDKRNAILDAAVQVIALQGLGAPTSRIAREAGVASGSLFTYFSTKVDLFNELYLELKTDMHDSAMRGVAGEEGIERQCERAWHNWTRWAVKNRYKRKVLALLGTSDEISESSLLKGHQIMASLAALLDEARAGGPMCDEPMPLVASFMNALAEATMDIMIKDPARAEQHCSAGFKALWRVIA